MHKAAHILLSLQDNEVNENGQENNGDHQEKKKGFCDETIFRLELLLLSWDESFEINTIRIFIV